jgi:hypothetical protein
VQWVDERGRRRRRVDKRVDKRVVAKMETRRVDESAVRR